MEIHGFSFFILKTQDSIKDFLASERNQDIFSVGKLADFRVHNLNTDLRAK